MKLRQVGFSLALIFGSLGMCKADTIGPLTFGSPFPFGYDGTFVGGAGAQFIPLVGKGIYESSPNGPLFFDYVVPFSFDVAAGWAISNLSLHNSVDYNNAVTVGQWGYEFAEKVTLCPTIGGCSTVKIGDAVGTATMPPIPLNAQATAGNGVYEVSGYLLNQQIGTNGGLQFLTVDLVPIPEGSTFLLLVSGIAGLPFVGALRRGNRRDASPEDAGA